MTKGLKKGFITLLFTVVLIGVGIVLWQLFLPTAKETIFTVKVPRLSETALSGKDVFDKHCKQCHGANAAGSNRGPPLVHPVYNPGHHADASFYIAVQRGVPRHHWDFGAMPPQPQVTEVETAAIVRYVRELQAANGISYETH